MTLNETLQRWTVEAPDRRLFVFLRDGEDVAGELTYGELDRRARTVAAQLSELTKPGDRVLLLFEPGLDYIITFFACLYSGRVAVPVYPPNPRRLEQTLPRLLHIVGDAQPAAVATTAMIRQLAEPMLGSMGFGEMAWCATDEAPADAEFADATRIDEGSLAFLQYTSGSTAKPRGVRVTHGNLLSNSKLISNALRADVTTVGVSWLPLYHDMGLIGKIITPAVIGCSVILMSPLDYLRRPARWLQAISRFGGTVSAAPNFAYDLCVKKVTDEELDALDLSTWQVALNGAEPVLAGTLNDFAERFARAGFRREAFLPAYGLAESTLIVTGAKAGPVSFDVASGSLERGEIVFSPGEGRTLISSGSVPGEKHCVKVVDAERRVELPEGSVGEIWVCGPSVADGYWERPELSDELFRARLAQDDGNVYLRTGDLGFLVGEELVVTGRRKDLMILRGRNIYPQDVEATVSGAHEAVRPGGMAVFSVDGPSGEVAVVVAELERRTTSGRAGDDRRRTETLPDWEVSEAPRVGDVAQSIKAAVLAEHRVDVAHVVLIKPGSVPKTSSGKIQRRECRRQFLAGELDEFGRLSKDDTPPSVSIVTELPVVALRELSYASRETRVAILKEYLTELAAYTIGCGLDNIGTSSLMAAGLDSLLAMEFQYTIEEQLGVRLFPSLLLGGATVVDVAEELADADFAAAAERNMGLEDASSEVFSEPSEGHLTETIRFEVSHRRGTSDIDDRLSFSEDPNPWGPTPTVEFHVSEQGGDVSWNEKGFWLYQKAFPKSWAPNLYYAGELPETVESRGLREAAHRVVARHENLRSRYLTIAGEPVRAFAEDGALQFEIVDATDWSRDQLIGSFEELASRPFDLEDGPIIRFGYYRRGEDAPILFMAMHHIAADFWSLERLIREVADEVSGVEVAEPRVTYSDYVSWQRNFMASDRGAWCERYWQEQLAGEIPRLRLPVAATAATKKRDGFGRAHRAHLEKALVASVDSLAVELGATRYTVLLAAYQILLHRWAGQSDMLVGAVAAGRTRRFFRDVLGMFANPLPIRSRIAGSTTFIEHLAQTQLTLLSAMDAQEYPLQAMLERFELRRDGVDNPIVQTLFASEQPREGSLEIGASVGGLRTVDIGLAGTVFDFTVMVYQGPDGGELRVQYNDAKYDEETVARLAQSYREILSQIVADPNVTLGSIALVDLDEQTQIARGLGRGDALHHDEVPVHAQFERCAASHPERVAVVEEGRNWTYGELDRAANRIANRLIAVGVTPGARVGVEVNRSAQLIASLYGVLKAGAGYVALQPTLPEKRLEYMAVDSGVDVVISDEPSRNTIGSVRLDVREILEKADGSETSPDVAIDREQLAYVLYTSGTTGLPKGVMLPHRAVSNLVSVIAQRYPVDASDSILQKTPYSFDISVSEIFNPLASGARLVMTRPGSSRDPGYLRDLILEHRVTVLRMTPTELATLMEADEIAACAEVVRRVLSCGEALTPEVCRRTFQHWPQVELINLWGPTEACVYASWWPCSAGAATIPIGLPLPNYRLYNLDDGLNVLPVDVQGELFVAGPSLARGYHGLPGKTALTYLPDPYASEPGARMYKSGDLVSWNRDGQLDFFGRKDNQIQLRGMRIELGELESILEQHEAVRQAAVRALTAPDGRVEALAAYVVLEPGRDDVDATALRAHLGEHVEDAKIPGQFVQLKEMPLTPSGKIDRKLLPDPDERMRSSVRMAPSTPAEETIAAIWCRHLKVTDIGVNENFFEIGGHSLLAVRIQHDIMRSFGTDLALGVLFENPTIATLAEVLAHGNTAFEPLPQRSYGDIAPLSAGQRSLWIQQYMQPDAVTFQAPGVFALTGALNIDALRAALLRLAERHEVLRSVFPLDGVAPVQRILSVEEASPLEYEDLRDSDSPEIEARELVAELVAIPFDLQEEPPFRPILLRLGEESWVLCLLFHHIAFDEWSADILFREIEQLYVTELGERVAVSEAGRVEAWRATYQAAYREVEARLAAGEVEDPTFTTDGWISSYTGERYLNDEMRDWLTGTLAELKGRKLGRVLEIGCGTGMVLFELADQADAYVGVDFSESALAYINAVRAQLDRDLSHVELVLAAAHELDKIEGEFDTVIINSVAQYFPDRAYLENVVGAVCARLRPGGTLFLGDLRDSRTVYPFHASVAHRRLPDSVSREGVRRNTEQRYLHDNELTMSPAEIVELASTVPQIEQVDFTIPAAAHATEMSLFRFNAYLTAGSRSDGAGPTIVEWAGEDFDGLLGRLENVGGGESLAVVGIPSARLAPEIAYALWLLEPKDAPFVPERVLPVTALSPDRVREHAARLGFHTTLSPSADELGFCFDAVFTPVRGDDGEKRAALSSGVLPARRRTLPGDPSVEQIDRFRGEAARLDELAKTAPDPLPEEPFEEHRHQFAEFAFWEQERLATEQADVAARYWADELRGASPAIAWPRLAEVAATGHPAKYHQHRWSTAISDIVASYARAHGCSEFLVLQAAYSAFLARWTGQEDLVIGVGTTLRQRPEFRDVIGYLLNMVPFRAEIDEDDTFHTHLRRSRERWEKSEPHQWLPLEKIVEHGGMSGAGGGGNLYESIFTFIPGDLMRRSGVASEGFRRSLAGLQVSPFDYGGVPHAVCTLNVSAYRAGGRLATEFEYDAAKLPVKEVENMSRLFEQEVQRLLQQPHRPMSDIASAMDLRAGTPRRTKTL